MQSSKRYVWLVFALPLILAVVSLGCGLSDVVGNVAANDQVAPPTRTPMPTFTPTPEGAAFVEVVIDNQPAAGAVGAGSEAAEPQPQAEPPTPTATNTPEPPPTPAEPTATNTPENSGPPSVTVLQNMNVRSGPGTNYPIAASAAAGDNAPIVGRNADSSWVQVQNPAGVGWLYADLVQINGDLASIGVVEAPPPPVVQAPAPEPEAPQEEAPPPPPPEPQYQFTPTGWHASGNAGIVHFKGRIRDEAGNLVNGYSVLVDNWSWSVLSHPSGASNHYPEKGDGEWDVVIADSALGGGVGWWWLTVVRYDCPNFFAAFDAQCKQFTRLSEDVKIQVNWPDETIINADWVCHWDCDKGLYVDGFRR